MSPSAPTPVDAVQSPGPQPPKNGLDRFFKISERGSTVSRELRGGLATFFAMAYIVVLNPIILGAGQDKFGHHLDNGQLVTATALMAGLSTLLMGVIGNVPIAVAAGLGINAVVSLQLAPKMSWPDAMGMVVLAGLVLMILVASGLRQRVMDAIPNGLRRAIAIGIGLFISLVGLVDAGFVTRNPDAAHTTVPLALGQGGQLQGWPVLVFVVGLALMFVLTVRKTKGAILIGMVVMAVVAIIINAVAEIPDASWGLAVPNVPDSLVGAPDFGLIGQISLFGGFKEVGLLTGCLFVFTVLLSGFFDAMGTIIGVGEEAGLTDENGSLPGMGRILMVDGIAVAAGGVGSASANTCFVESTAGVGEGARTGLANVVTGGLFLLALVFTPLATVVPSQAATPALLVVGFLIMSANVREIDWSDFTVAVPAFLTIISMPFTYSITNGIGMGVLAFILLRTATGRFKEIPWLLNAVGLAFLVYFLLNPIEQVLGVR
ncbi:MULTISPECIES: NCS2 family permease [Streptomyces]|uniref:NCS2 family permease n=2 Tax=Streptomyces rimosus subsp. rimosus TaxID=132474 RepID=L8ET95_STRR1|nr:MULTISPECIES: NCS2 family permease [Streptomyces]KOG72434.1 MFS transporter [Kitasatospora aureofaciens]MYT42843.1 NCS2 family permease [Streptomyces sp. SID5471]KEF05305.1 MFS transporter [Streptomyces rimosus]KEF18912.1 MFS transporter [Streptomyces rimosus]KOT31450.1 MFS transporter [Streptomyces rimosus subsp. rimosus]